MLIDKSASALAAAADADCSYTCVHIAYNGRRVCVCVCARCAIEV